MAELVRIWKKDCEKLRRSFSKGENLEFETLVWVSPNERKRKRLFGKIEGVYPDGIRLSFMHSRYCGTIKCFRWLSYVQILMDIQSGNVPFDDCGSNAYQ